MAFICWNVDFNLTDCKEGIGRQRGIFAHLFSSTRVDDRNVWPRLDRVKLRILLSLLRIVVHLTKSEGKSER